MFTIWTQAVMEYWHVKLIADSIFSDLDAENTQFVLESIARRKRYHVT